MQSLRELDEHQGLYFKAGFERTKLTWQETLKGAMNFTFTKKNSKSLSTDFR